jgi:hypothetical protein
MDTSVKDREEIKKGPLAPEHNRNQSLESLDGPKIPLEQADGDKGYSTNSEQGQSGVSLHLADEDKDRHQDPVAEAENLKESYDMAHESDAENKSGES